MTHDEIVAEIQARAERRGVLTHYCQRAIRCVGTPGMPDVFLVGPFGAAWLEVKTPGDHLDPGQTTWKYTLEAAGQEHYVVGPLDQVESGLVDALLDRLAGLEVTRRPGYTLTRAEADGRPVTGFCNRPDEMHVPGNRPDGRCECGAFRL